MSWWLRQYYKALEGPVYYGDSSAITADTTLTADNHVVHVDVDSGAVTLTLPASPLNRQQHQILCIDDNSTGNAVTVGRNGNTIQGQSTDLILLKDDASRLVYFDGYGWRIV